MTNTKPEESSSSSTTASTSSSDPHPKSTLRDLIISTTLNLNAAALASTSAVVPAPPGLNPQLTTVNFYRFSSRIGVVFRARRRVYRLISWYRTTDTLVAMAAYIFVCLYPKLLLLVPQLALLAIVIYNFHAKKVNQPKDVAEPLPPSVFNERELLKEEAEADEGFLANVEKKRQLYLNNMAGIQNMMGEFSDAYDRVVDALWPLAWENPEVTRNISLVLIASLVAMTSVMWFVPWRYVFLAGGILFFLANTPYARAVAKELQPIVLKWLNLWLGKTKMETGVKYLEEGARISVEVFENQRWWAEVGFTSQLLGKGMDGAWTDEMGKRRPPKDDIEPPRGYAWSEEKWHMATQEWAQNKYGGGVRPDSDGWVYFDRTWQKPREESAMGGLEVWPTRRRVWVRKGIREEGKKKR
ncbi:uncharacterized protein VTP21DRAFT_7417 [Calcarisporiella thermophila]|uniref:uncharacterized protein n=1 Tax=Calcarisporiella thermophila TaxID=911321 RepID=UPI0037423F0B